MVRVGVVSGPKLRVLPRLPGVRLTHSAVKTRQTQLTPLHAGSSGN